MGTVRTWRLACGYGRAPSPVRLTRRLGRPSQCEASVTAERDRLTTREVRVPYESVRDATRIPALDH